MEDFDVIVVGGGHAGAEAAYAASRLGQSVALFTINMDTIGRMPCSPSIGGLAKSHLVKEIDALGGIMARAADETAIQYRVLNTKKGPAVRATRTQNDRWLYEAAVKEKLEAAGIHLRQARVDSIETSGSAVSGIIDHTGMFYGAKAVIITAGTFLSGTIHIGEKRIPAGRAGEEGAYELSECIRGLGFAMGRHKTGTPPRLNADSVDFDRLERQDPIEEVMPFSLDSQGPFLDQVPCYMTRTTPETHAIIRDNIHLSALYSGAITGTPARYCPSLEDKVMRFGDRGGHQVIIEPEGLHTKEVYASGLGNSLPVELQWKIVHSVPGLEKAEIVRNAYAIEYDYILPTQLLRTLETRAVQGLYLAGQVNGTSGYEEAAAQGLMAAVNASLKIQGKEPLILDRSQAYIAVMIDDLVTRGTSEPYRMFTSRAEYRLMLRETNALFRLSETAHALGLITDERRERVRQMHHEISDMREYLAKATVMIPDDMPEISPSRGAASERVRMDILLKRPEVNMEAFRRHGLLPDMTRLCAVEVEIGIKYEGYIQRQIQEIDRLKEMEKIKIPEGIDFRGIEGLSNELRSRLTKIRPKTLGQAFLIEGMTPAGMQALKLGIRLSGS